MQTTTTYLDRVRPAIEQAGEPDPDLRLPHSDWTVREATAHVVTVAPAMPTVPSAAAPGSTTLRPCPR